MKLHNKLFVFLVVVASSIVALAAADSGTQGGGYVLKSAGKFPTPVSDAWLGYLNETSKFPMGGFYPTNIDRSTPGTLMVSVLEDSLRWIGNGNIVPCVVGGSGNLNHKTGWRNPDGAFYLEKEYEKDKPVNVYGKVEVYAGGLEQWFPKKGVHACIGEEENGNNPWGIKEFTKDSLANFATNAVIQKCLQAGGEVQSLSEEFSEHNRVRKSKILYGILPVPRHCLSAHVVLKCGFNSRKEDIKNLVKQFSQEYPSNPSQIFLDKFAEDL